MLYRAGLALALLLILPACGSVPTVTEAPTQTPVIIVVTATLPPATPRPTITIRPTPRPWPTAKPRTPTIPRPTRTPRPTPVPTATATLGPSAVPSPTPMPTIDVSGMSDAAYREYLRTRFGIVGDRPIGFKQIEILNLRHDGLNDYRVWFYVTDESNDYLYEEDTRAGRQQWANDLLAELQRRWPGEDVAGFLVHAERSRDYFDGTCVFTSSDSSDITADGWINYLVHARVGHTPSLNLDPSIDCVD